MQKNNLEEQIDHNNKVIPFTILLSKRRSISIEIAINGRVKVRAPYHTSMRYIKNCVLKKAEWIINKQEYFRSLAPKASAEKKYEDGERFEFLGNLYELKIITDIISGVKLNHNWLEVSIPVSKLQKIKVLIEKWYISSAEEVFFERLEECKKRVEKLNIYWNGNLRFRKMRRRWGSCSHSGKICLNYELIKAPIKCIDYVILHELCHLKEFNHSPAFYNLLTAIMPDWKKVRDILNQRNRAGIC